MATDIRSCILGAGALKMFRGSFRLKPESTLGSTGFERIA